MVKSTEASLDKQANSLSRKKTQIWVVLSDWK